MPSSTPSSTSSSIPNTALSPGSTAAIAVCATIAGLALIALGIIFWRWKQRKVAFQEACLGAPVNSPPNEMALVSPNSERNSNMDPLSQPYSLHRSKCHQNR
ncbi:hypothetical protein AOQ84DRAFT_383799 [Glonium stellatum]|uniref:Uncharacterized protein n=1 Tax=Glonium stellatum TaxID=574774 RepID=A0A8E2EMT7_9PEZI|nr:hypothetical protein AOQ84DRAFT_383799 [Glonium stellatum]